MAVVAAFVAVLALVAVVLMVVSFRFEEGRITVPSAALGSHDGEAIGCVDSAGQPIRRGNPRAGAVRSVAS